MTAGALGIRAGFFQRILFEFGIGACSEQGIRGYTPVEHLTIKSAKNLKENCG